MNICSNFELSTLKVISWPNFDSVCIKYHLHKRKKNVDFIHAQISLSNICNILKQISEKIINIKRNESTKRQKHLSNNQPSMWQTRFGV